MLAERELIGASFSSDGKLLGQKQRKVCEDEGGLVEKGEGGKEIWTTDKEQRGRAESKTDESADVMQKKKPENKPKKQYILLL